jgi:hypothetical protein
VYQYHVDFDPPIQIKRLKIALIKSNSLFERNSAFDGSTLFTTVRLPDDDTTLIAKNKRTETDYKMMIKKTADIYPTADNFQIERFISMEDEEVMIQRPPRETREGEQPRRLKDKKNDFIRLLNIVFKKYSNTPRI